MRRLICLLITLHGLLNAEPKERWVYASANYQVSAEADRIIALMKRAKRAGYTHFLLADAKFARLTTVLPRYFAHAEKVRVTATELGLHIVPTVFGIGYSNDLLANDSNLAEGLPVRDALFVVKDLVAGHVPHPDVRLVNSSFSHRHSWAFIDDTLKQEGGALRSEAVKDNARFSQKLKLQPFRQYHVSVEIKTKGFVGGQAEIKVIAKDGTQLNYTGLNEQPAQDWTSHHLTFNSLSHNEAQIYFGVWSGHEGAISWRQPHVEECGLVNVLRRPGTPFTVKREDGKPLTEGIDFEPLRDTELGISLYAGQYEAWKEPLQLQVRGVEDGVRLRVSYFHPHIIHDHQVCACVSEPALMKLLQQQAQDVAKLWQAGDFMMGHDEWRVMNWCAACTARQLSPGQIAAENVRSCTDILSRLAPAARLFIWSDMFDPHHNARMNYYLVNGDLTGSWDGLDKRVTIVNWNSHRAEESLAFFAQRGHPQLIAGYYDGPLERTRQWLRVAKAVPGITGVMYTTWKNDYAELEAFAQMLAEEGF